MVGGLVGVRLEKEGGQDDDGGEERHREVLSGKQVSHGYIYGWPCDQVRAFSEMREAGSRWRAGRE